MRALALSSLLAWRLEVPTLLVIAVHSPHPGRSRALADGGRHVTPDNYRRRSKSLSNGPHQRCHLLCQVRRRPGARGLGRTKRMLVFDAAGLSGECQGAGRRKLLQHGTSDRPGTSTLACREMTPEAVVREEVWAITLTNSRRESPQTSMLTCVRKKKLRVKRF